jgi:hypothetical protein
MKRLLTAVVIFSAFLFVRGASAQTVMPLMGIGTPQFFTNAGAVCSGCYIYTYAAGTTTQQATYTNSVGNVLNANPTPLDSTGHIQSGGMWLTNTAYKFQGCLQNDGAACASGDILWTQDNVPGFGGGGSGSSSSPFISASPNPSTAGILRLANGDSIGIRNAGLNANWLIGLKGANNSGSGDILTLPFPALQVVTGSCPSGGATVDLLCAGATRWQMSNAGGALVNVVASGQDINTSDQVTSTHLSSALPVAQGGTGVTTSVGGGSNVVLASGVTGSGNAVLATSPTVTSPTFNTSVPNGTGFQRATSGATSMAANSVTSVTINWGVSWADTGYYTVCTLSGMSTSLSDVFIGGVVSQATGSVVVSVNNNLGSPLTRTVNCIGVHP